MILKLFSLISIPHELLHVLAFRLIDKPYHYQLGDLAVKPIDPLTKRERLFVTLLPFGVTFLLYIILFAGALFVANKIPLLAIILGNLTIPVGLYVFFSLEDLRQAWRLITGGEQTPFDFIFQINQLGLQSARASTRHIWVAIGVVLAILIMLLLKKAN
jgi:hypothetical protein